MISDCGNKIKSTKFVVWLNEDGSGILGLAAKKKSLPPGLLKDRKFSTMQHMLVLMNAFEKSVKQVENKKQETLLEYGGYWCLGCNTVFPKSELMMVHYKGKPHTGPRTVAHCPCCSSPRIEKIG